MGIIIPTVCACHPCPNCNALRRCDIIHRHIEYPWDGVIHYKPFAYNIFQCKGCGSYFFGLERHSLLQDDDVYFQYFPGTSLVKTDERIVQSLCDDDLIQILSLYSEIVSAINNNMPQLASLGIRTLVDRIAIDNTDSNVNFSKNLNNLHSKGLISLPQQNALRSVLDVGDGVTHRGHVPSMSDVQGALNIVEDLMKVLYLHKSMAKRIMQNVPPHPASGN